MRNLALIVNPVSGNGKALNILPEVKSYFNLHSEIITIETRISRYQGNIEELSKELYEKGFREFIVLGGDGSLSEMVNGLAPFRNNKIVVGVIPYGSGNDFIKSAYGTSKLNIILRSIVNRDVKLIDIGKVNEMYFINSCTFGIDGPIIQMTDKLKKKMTGKLAYYISTLTEGVKFKPSEVKLTLDDYEITGKKLIVALNNGQFIGGGMKFTPEAKFTDEKLSACIVDDVSKAFFLRNLKKVYEGNLFQLDAVAYYDFEQASISVSGRQYAINIDGNLVGKTPAQISIQKKAINIFCDPEYVK